MPVMYNFKKGHAEYIADDAVVQNVQSGTHGFRKNVEIPVVSPDGTPGTIPSENASQAFSGDYGFTYRGNAEAMADYKKQIAEEQAQAFDNPLWGAAAGTLGAASTATFGLSDVAIRGAYGKRGADAVRQLEEAQPTATLIGNIAGGLVPTGGVAGLGIKGAAKIGSGASSLAKSALGSARADTLIGKAVQSGLGLGTEAMLYGGGQVVSQAALGDPQLNAQNALSTIGLAGLTGGVLGGAAAPSIKAFQAVKGGLQKIGQSIPVIAESTAKNTFNITDKAVESMGPLYQKILGVLRPMGDDADDVARAFAASNKQGRATIFRYMEDPVAATNDATSAFKKVLGEGNLAAKQSMKARNALTEEIGKTAPKMTKEIAQDFEATMDVFGKAMVEAEKNPHLYNKSLIKQFEAFVDSTLDVAYDARTKKLKLKKSITPARAHEIAYNLRKDMDNYLGMFKSEGTGAAVATSKMFEKVRENLTKHIRNDKVYGAPAKKWAQFDDAYANWKNSITMLTKPMLRKKVGWEATDVGNLLVDPNKIAAFVRNPENIKGQAFRGHVERLKESIINMRKASDEFAEQFAIPKSEDTIQSLDALLGQVSSIEQARAAILAINRVESQTGKSVIPTLLGMAGGGAAGGAIGSALGAGGGAMLANPRMMFRYIAQYEKKRSEGVGALKAAVETFLTRGKKTAQQIEKAAAKRANAIEAAGSKIKTVGKVSIAQAAEMFAAGETPSKNKDDISQLKANLVRFTSSPEVADNMLRETYPLLDDSMPEEYAAYNGVLVRAAQFLNSKIPGDRSAAQMIPGSIRLSRSETQKIESYINAVSNPQIIFEQMKSGNLNPETVEAIEMVYPDMFQSIQTQVMDMVTDAPEKLDYKKKLELGVLFRVPTTEGLARIVQNQAAMRTIESERKGTINQSADLSVLANQTSSDISRALD